MFDFDPITMQLSDGKDMFTGSELLTTSPVWSYDDPDVIYGLAKTGARIIGFNVETQQVVFNKDLSDKLPEGLHAAQMSKAHTNDRFFSFSANAGGGNDDANKRYACAYDRELDELYYIDITASNPEIPAGYDECHLNYDGTMLFLYVGEGWATWDYANDRLYTVMVGRDGTGYELARHGHYDVGQDYFVNAWVGDDCNETVIRPLTDLANFEVLFKAEPGFSDWESGCHYGITGPNDVWVVMSNEYKQGNSIGTDYSHAFRNEIWLWIGSCFFCVEIFSIQY
jgi:hypothetical protein